MYHYFWLFFFTVIQEYSSNLFLGVFIRVSVHFANYTFVLMTLVHVCMFAQECGPLTYPGMVQAVLDKSFDVYILDLA